jgi:hypothetical protein
MNGWWRNKGFGRAAPVPEAGTVASDRLSAGIVLFVVCFLVVLCVAIPLISAAVIGQ